MGVVVVTLLDEFREAMRDFSPERQRFLVDCLFTTNTPRNAVDTLERACREYGCQLGYEEASAGGLYLRPISDDVYQFIAVVGMKLNSDGFCELVA